MVTHDTESFLFSIAALALAASSAHSHISMVQFQCWRKLKPEAKPESRALRSAPIPIAILTLIIALINYNLCRDRAKDDALINEQLQA